MKNVKLRNDIIRVLLESRSDEQVTYIADKIINFCLIEKTEPVTEVPCGGGLDAPYELRRLVDVCRQLFESTGGDAGKIKQSKAAWTVLGNALEYYKDKGI